MRHDGREEDRIERKETEEKTGCVGRGQKHLSKVGKRETSRKGKRQGRADRDLGRPGRIKGPIQLEGAARLTIYLASLLIIYIAFFFWSRDMTLSDGPNY